MDNFIKSNDSASKIRNATVIKKSGLTEFALEIYSTEKQIIGGKITHSGTGETFRFSDINEMIAIMLRKYDNMRYPQAQQKLRDWN